MRKDPLRIAAAQSTVSPDARANGQNIRELMRRASEEGARLVQFPEGALSGYVKTQIKKDWSGVDWDTVSDELEKTAAYSAELRIWTVLGSAHRLTAPNRPHNSLYVISETGAIVDRYDKRYCSNTEITDWFSPGFRPVTFEIDGYTFGTVLCIEVRFPELFAEYERLGVDCVLFSSYSDNPIFGTHAQAHAATNCYWLSFAVPAQCSHAVPANIIGPTGTYLAQAPTTGDAGLAMADLDRHDPGFEGYLTFARSWRADARAGDIYAARRVDDPRSHTRTNF